MSASSVPLVHRYGAPHELRPPVRCQYHLPSLLRPRLPQISLVSPRNGSLQLFDRDTSITLLLQEHTLPWQTSKCSSRVDGGLFAAWVGSTSPLVAPSSQLQQLWLFQAIAHWWFWKFGSPSRKSSDPFTSQLVSMHESEEARLECPLCIGLAPHTS